MKVDQLSAALQQMQTDGHGQVDVMLVDAQGNQVSINQVRLLRGEKRYLPSVVDTAPVMLIEAPQS